jgi:hypothetical protein
LSADVIWPETVTSPGNTTSLEDGNRETDLGLCAWLLDDPLAEPLVEADRDGLEADELELALAEDDELELALAEVEAELELPPVVVVVEPVVPEVEPEDWTTHVTATSSYWAVSPEQLAPGGIVT